MSISYRSSVQSEICCLISSSESWKFLTPKIDNEFTAVRKYKALQIRFGTVLYWHKKEVHCSLSYTREHHSIEALKQSRPVFESNGIQLDYVSQLLNSTEKQNTSSKVENSRRKSTLEIDYFYYLNRNIIPTAIGVSVLLHHLELISTMFATNFVKLSRRKRPGSCPWQQL